MLLSYLVAPPLLGYSTATSLLLGAIVGSHTLLAYPIVSRLGITKNKRRNDDDGGARWSPICCPFSYWPSLSVP